jgi:hypothetical protein
MTDLLFYETGDGGDLLLRAGDLVSVFGVENVPYLSMFSGTDWWGNYLLPETQQVKSKTEVVLRTTPLTSAGRMKILDAVNSDLSVLSEIPGTKWTVAVSISNPNRLDMIVNINGKDFSYTWNPDKFYLTYQV